MDIKSNPFPALHLHQLFGRGFPHLLLVPTKQIVSGNLMKLEQKGDGLRNIVCHDTKHVSEVKLVVHDMIFWQYSNPGKDTISIPFFTGFNVFPFSFWSSIILEFKTTSVLPITVSWEYVCCAGNILLRGLAHRPKFPSTYLDIDENLLIFRGDQAGRILVYNSQSRENNWSETMEEVTDIELKRIFSTITGPNSEFERWCRWMDRRKLIRKILDDNPFDIQSNVTVYSDKYTNIQVRNKQTLEISDRELDMADTIKALEGHYSKQVIKSDWMRKTGDIICIDEIKFVEFTIKRENVEQVESILLERPYTDITMCRTIDTEKTALARQQDIIKKKIPYYPLFDDNTEPPKEHVCETIECAQLNAIMFTMDKKWNFIHTCNEIMADPRYERYLNIQRLDYKKACNKLKRFQNKPFGQS